MNTFSILLGVVATEDLELKQLGVKTTFVQGDLEEDIYMSQPTTSRRGGRNLTSYVDGRKASMA